MSCCTGASLHEQGRGWVGLHSKQEVNKLTAVCPCTALMELCVSACVRNVERMVIRTVYLDLIIQFQYCPQLENRVVLQLLLHVDLQVKEHRGPLDIPASTGSG